MARSAAAPALRLVLACLAGSASAGRVLRAPNATGAAAERGLAADAALPFGAHQFMEVKLGPFASAPEACDYCFGSFTKVGKPPAGPVAPACVCMAYPDGREFTMFCATPTSAAGFVADKKGCRCKGRDMEKMAATTCEPIS
eukprot:CAMPEP_0204588146 /NCGR_PEP_ID=MMETSP0661-20131031/48457_1 /ASSEMBLY_ACC=CAM_ASM_000606 /TAXON_ID=109239 /ORGANISM="Alexandrium margalefi, Strain AMGDE01CS-322" /LENGTH=141 /DNA_ID=CAMNT_0051597941 /DNA_START=59 /DNA_END=484 /DNA_ORIENTATION=+